MKSSITLLPPEILSKGVVLSDCLEFLRNIPSMSVDLIYLDPPFFTQKEHKLTSRKGEEYSFSDCWESREAYLNFLRERLIEMHRVLKETGNIFLHCDNNASHHLRILLDDVFGESNFRSEIIWSYKRWSNSRKDLLPNHQVILFYSKSKVNTFNTIYTDYSPTTNIDQILQERARENGKAVYKRDDDGNIVSAGEKKGVPLSDVWDIPFLNPKAKERTGYPTQKPIELLKRIIEIGSNKGGIVLDPFCGSGTTLVAAKLMDRQFIGCDINPDAVSLSTERLEQPFMTESALLKKGVKSYYTKTEYEKAILEELDCTIVQRNKGIDGFTKQHIDGKPVAVKIQKHEESIDEAVRLLDAAGKKKGCSRTILVAHTELPKSYPENMTILKGFDLQMKMKKMAE